MKLEQAQTIAEGVLAQLMPQCERAEIAGSIRRQNPEVKDIEIVAVPKPYDVGLFASGIATVVDQWQRIKGQLPCKYTQVMLPEGIKLDLFLVQPGNFGWQLALRTGSSDFNKYVLLRKLKDNYLRSEDGWIYRGDTRLMVREESELFRLINMPYLEPVKRNYKHPLT
ncbi:hypothetical protein [Reichenbachiella sp.]|uniref:hypothetical protein n=1 Tax=Reichenbachiella sp. TaxID=2184521 RepID=UPI003B5C0DD2